jgi:hypothetical protein
MRDRFFARWVLAALLSAGPVVACAGGVDDLTGTLDDGGGSSADAPAETTGHQNRDAAGDGRTTHPDTGTAEASPEDAPTEAQGDDSADATDDAMDSTVDADAGDSSDATIDALDANDANPPPDAPGDGGVGPDCAVSFPNNLFVQDGGTNASDGGAAPDDATAPAQAANLMNLDFGSTTTTKAGVAAAGSSAADFWNPVGPGFQADFLATGLLWADGSSSNVQMRVTNLPGNWGSASAIHDPMYDGYEYSWSGTTATITIVNLPSGTYDVYVYSSVTGGNTGSSVSACASGASTPTQFTSTSAYATDTVWIAGDEYALHAGVSVAASDVVTINLSNGTQGSGNAGILVNGVQLVRH